MEIKLFEKLILHKYYCKSTEFNCPTVFQKLRKNKIVLLHKRPTGRLYLCIDLYDCTTKMFFTCTSLPYLTSEGPVFIEMEHC